MANKDVKARDEDHSEDEDDDDPDAGVPVAQASPAARSAAQRAASRGSAARSSAARGASVGASAAAAHRKPALGKAHGNGHAAKGHGHDHDATEDEAQDPTWWAPYAALGALVLIGVLGFFGTFNSFLKPLFSPMPQRSAEPAQAAHAPTPPPAPAPPPGEAKPATPAADTFGAKHVLVMHKESKRVPPGITRTKEEAMARAKEALAKAKAPGAKFEDVVKDYSDEPNAAQRGGNLGNFRKGAMVKEFQEGLEKTKVGEISDIVETPFGYHVILRTK